jgi:hypothetical protein
LFPENDYESPNLSSATLILLAVSATAQNSNAPVATKPPLNLSDEQRRKIQDALVTAHSAQKTRDKFEAKVGEKVPTKLKLDPMPAPLSGREQFSSLSADRSHR